MSKNTKIIWNTWNEKKNEWTITMSSVRIPMNPAFRGSLGSFGYHATLPPAPRRRALLKAARFWGLIYVIRKLNAVYVFNKYRRPDLATIFKDDRDYLRGKYRAARDRGESGGGKSPQAVAIWYQCKSSRNTAACLTKAGRRLKDSTTAPRQTRRTRRRSRR